MALIDGDGCLHVVKRPGKIAALGRRSRSDIPAGTCGIAHTRWATHGRPTSPTRTRTPPAGSDIALVHNGIIENADMRCARGCAARDTSSASETDTEVVVHLIDYLWKAGMAMEDAVAAALAAVHGAYGIAVVSSREPGQDRGGPATAARS